MYRTKRGPSAWVCVALGVIAAHPATPPLLALDKPAPGVDRDVRRPSATRALLEPAPTPLLVQGPSQLGNVPPTMTIAEPIANITRGQGDPFLVKWVDADPDSAAKIRFSLVNTQTNSVIVLVDGIEEDDQVGPDNETVATSLIPAGTYNLLGTIADEETSVDVFAMTTGTTPARVIVTVVAAGGTTNLNVSVESGGSNSIAAVPGHVVNYEVVGLLNDDDNQGLGLVGFDLDFDGGDLSRADAPTGDPNSGCENPMIHFTEPWGITNPTGFGGTVINGDLIQVGGAQNTINNTQPPVLIGTVLLGVGQPSGCGPAVLVTGALTAPSVPGSYTLALENLFANIIAADATGVPFWRTQAAGVGTVANLTIFVGNAAEPEGACCLQSNGGCALMTAAACAASGGTYGGDDSTCGTDHDADGVADVCDACPESNVADTVVIDECDSGVQNRLFDDGCTMLDEIEQCAAGVSRHGKFVRCVVAIVNQWRTDSLITSREGSGIVRCVARTGK